MTVRELISLLAGLPQDMLVTDGIDKITFVCIKDEWYDGDSANPNNKPMEVVVVS